MKKAQGTKRVRVNTGQLIRVSDWIRANRDKIESEQWTRNATAQEWGKTDGGFPISENAISDIFEELGIIPPKHKKLFGSEINRLEVAVKDLGNYVVGLRADAAEQDKVIRQLESWRKTAGESGPIAQAELNRKVENLTANFNTFNRQHKDDDQTVLALIDKCNRLEVVLKNVVAEFDKIKAELGIKRIDTAVHQSVTKRA